MNYKYAYGIDAEGMNAIQLKALRTWANYHCLIQKQLKALEGKIMQAIARLILKLLVKDANKLGTLDTNGKVQF